MPRFNWGATPAPKYRYLVYGVPGVGKTTLSEYLPGRVFMLSLDNSFQRVNRWQGSEDIWAIDPKAPIEDLQEFAVEFNPDEYDWLVIDNLSNLQKLWFVEKANETSNHLDNKLQHYGEFTNWVIRFISKMFSYNLNILVTCWEGDFDVTEANGQTFQQHAPDLRPSARDYLMGNCDVVGRMVVNPKTGGHGLVLEGDIGTYAKNRLDNRKGCEASELFLVQLPEETGNRSTAETSPEE